VETEGSLLRLKYKLPKTNKKAKELGIAQMIVSK
jgi:hypothetical protein